MARAWIDDESVVQAVAAVARRRHGIVQQRQLVDQQIRAPGFVVIRDLGPERRGRVHFRRPDRRRSGDDAVEIERIAFRFHQSLPAAGREAAVIRVLDRPSVKPGGDGLRRQRRDVRCAIREVDLSDRVLIGPAGFGTARWWPISPAATANPSERGTFVSSIANSPPRPCPPFIQKRPFQPESGKRMRTPTCWATCARTPRNTRRHRPAKPALPTSPKPAHPARARSCATGVWHAATAAASAAGTTGAAVCADAASTTQKAKAMRATGFVTTVFIGRLSRKRQTFRSEA